MEESAAELSNRMNTDTGASELMTWKPFVTSGRGVLGAVWGKAQTGGVRDAEGKSRVERR